LIETIYPNISNFPHPSDQYFSDHILLLAHDEDIYAIKSHILNNFPGNEHVYHSADSVGLEGDEEEFQYLVEHLNSMNASGLPLAKLVLKKGCSVMVLRNLNPSQGVCNGTWGNILTQMTNCVLEIRLLGGDHAGEHVFIPCITMIPSAMQIPFELCRCQFPICLAFTMTINKAQDQSVKYVGLDFRSSVFTHGQFYVAISCATSVHRIKAIWDPKNIEIRTKNVVYYLIINILDNYK
jgi:ATP-dependent exoDNAse (exonuclease V) alpha subunit